MKTFLVLLVLPFLSVLPSHAGHPDVDPAVRKLRNDFALAQTPTVAQLRLNEPWNCVELMAHNIGEQQYFKEQAFLFRQVDGVFLNDGIFRSKVFIYGTNKGFIAGVVGQEPNLHFLSAVRVTSKGDLISEWSSNQYAVEIPRVASLVDAAYYVNSYSVCVKSE